ncbi:hypothetical protein Syun_027727 [Stephania yunnanensis]|uniref:Uncharacterized protein n=1 Tax=Stephania yunnanensis TaxID=152371 RepID=A0AAP0EG54_9MAGN
MNAKDHGDKLRKKHVKKHKKRKERDENVDFGNREGENDHFGVLVVKEKIKLKKVVKGKEEKWKKEKKNKNKESITVSSVEVIKDGSVGKDKGIKGFDYFEREEISSTKIGDGSDIMKEKRKKKKKKKKTEHVKENNYKNDHSNRKMAKKPVKVRSATIVDVKVSQHGRLNSLLTQKSDGKEKYLVDGMEKSDHINKEKVKPIKDNEEKIINNPSMNIKRKNVKPIKDNEDNTINKGDPSMIVSDQNAEHVRNSDLKKMKRE